MSKFPGEQAWTKEEARRATTSVEAAPDMREGHGCHRLQYRLFRPGAGGRRL
jgi:hypothetical protein